MRFISLLSFIIPLCLFAHQQNEWAPSSITRIKDSLNPALGNNTCKIHLVLGNSEITAAQPILLQGEMNNVYTSWNLAPQTRSAEQLLESGKYNITLFLSPNYEAIASTPFEFASGHEIWLYCYFAPKVNNYYMVEKPVIYTYSKRPVSVEIQVRPSGEMQFSYPPYKDGWKGIAQEDGSFLLNGIRYPYLFWDAQIQAEKFELDWSQSTLIPKSDVVSFLEKQLDIVGLNEKEKIDFITYWGPQLVNYPMVELLFVQDKATAQFATLTCSDPQFTIERLYLVYRIPEITNKKTSVQSNLMPLKRSEFYLFEWGGAFVPSQEE